METKSTENYSAAELLLREEYYSTCIHAFYYSSLQFVKHILYERYNIDYDQQKNEAKNSEHGSHNYLIFNIANLIREDNGIKENKRKSHEIKNILLKLKDLRVAADYGTVEMTAYQANMAKVDTDEIKRKLN